jgi:hypothetical protein
MQYAAPTGNPAFCRPRRVALLSFRYFWNDGVSGEHSAGFFAKGKNVCGIPMARLAGIEPTTLGFGGQYSIH